jgi:hypothetical protein
MNNNLVAFTFLFLQHKDPDVHYHKNYLALSLLGVASA